VVYQVRAQLWALWSSSFCYWTKVLLRKDWIAAIAFVAIFTGLNSGSPTRDHIPPIFWYMPSPSSLCIVLSCTTDDRDFTVDMFANLPFTANLSVGMSTSIFALVSVVALAVGVSTIRGRSSAVSAKVE